MAVSTNPYIAASPGDLVTAEAWNGMQVRIKEDIASRIDQVTDALEEHATEPVDAAKFGGKTPAEWTELFAPKVHDHEGVAAYRRYIKRFTQQVSEVLLPHNLGRFPLVDAYTLLPVIGDVKDDVIKADFGDCKVLFYYGHADLHNFDLMITVYRDRVPLGLPFEEILRELGVQYEDDDSIADVVDEMWAALSRDPNDEIKHCTTKWIDDCCRQERTVADLKRGDEWNDLFVALRPLKCGIGGVPPCKIEVTQVNYNTLHLEAPDLTAQTSPLDVMLLLRS